MTMVLLPSMTAVRTQPLKRKTALPMQQSQVLLKMAHGQVLLVSPIRMMQTHTQWDGEFLYHLFLHSLVPLIL